MTTMQTISEKHSVLYKSISESVTDTISLCLKELTGERKKNTDEIRQLETFIRKIQENSEKWHKNDSLTENVTTEEEVPEKTEDAKRASACCLELLHLIEEAQEALLSAAESRRESGVWLTGGAAWSVLLGNADALVLLFYACSGEMKDRSLAKKMNSEALKYRNLLTKKREKNYYGFFDRIIEEKISLANQLHKC